MRFKPFAILFAVALTLFGISLLMEKPFHEEVRTEFIASVTRTGAEMESDYLVVDDGQMIIFSSAPLRGRSGIQAEKMYLTEFINIMNAVIKWKRNHPEEKVSIAVSERGGNSENYNVDSAYYTVRVVLLRE